MCSKIGTSWTQLVHGYLYIGSCFTISVLCSNSLPRLMVIQDMKIWFDLNRNLLNYRFSSLFLWSVHELLNQCIYQLTIEITLLLQASTYIQSWTNCLCMPLNKHYVNRHTLNGNNITSVLLYSTVKDFKKKSCASW